MKTSNLFYTIFHVFYSMELYLDVTHTPSENEFAEFEAEDPFMENFIATLDRQLAAFEPLLIPVNYQVNFWNLL